MGRQKGDGGRSKAKPSSSSLAASLLPSASSASTAGFGGYVGSSRLDHSVSGDHVASFSDVDGELALHLKRLARKDPTTKLKALASLSELIKQKPGKDNVSIIPQWAFEYKRLLLDYNREVRRAAHETMTSLVTSVGRDLAPHLKSLMGPWWFSQFDSVSDVSQAAKQSLQAAFPAQEKRLDALILCTNEIFLYLEENLKLTPQNLSDRAAALDEVEEIHQQVISSTLLAFAMLLDVLIREQLERSGTGKVSAEPRRASASATAIRFTEKLFAEHKYFIDFLKSQSPSIRSATYLVLSSLIRNIPHAFSEGNMKTIAGSILGAFLEKDPSCHASLWEAVLLFSKRFPDSWTYVNVQKAILGRFWSFLRNGCFGSRRISYPALVLFLDTVPPKAIAGESFFLEFFQNLWDGRNPFHSSNADRVAFFQAFKECFLWALQNASRYYGEADSIHFQATLVDNILLKLLWEDYLFLGSSKVHERFFSKNQSKDDNFGDNKKRVEAVNTKYPVSYSQELGKSIVEIVSSIHSYDHNILSSFCAEFQKNCLEIFQLVETMDKSSEIEQVIQFILQLEDRAKQKGEDWPLVLLVGPALSSSFPLIRSLDSPDGARLLFIAVSLFGPRKVVREILHQYNDQGKLEQKSEFEQFVEMFKGSFVPWCMHGDGRSTSARLDLLLALLDDECFSEQWHSVITYAIDQENFGAVAQSIDSDRLAMLAKLLDKARLKIAIQDVKRVTNNCQGAIPNHWHHELLESTAVAIAHSHSLLGTSYSSFLCSVLGGLAERQQTSFVSRNALIVIFEELSHKLVSFILQSPVTWGRNAGSLLAAGSHNFGLESESSDLFERAKFALEVLDGSFFCLQALGENNEVVPNILAAIHIIDWQCYIGGVNFGFDDSKEESKVMLNLGKWVHALRCKMTDQFWSLNRDNRRKLGNILVLSIRSAIFENDERHDDEIPSLCCQWMLEVLTHLSQDPDDEQFMLDQLLTRGNSWPFYVNSESTQKESAFSNMKSSSVDIQNFGNQKFVSLVNKLISKIGIEKVVVGRFNHVPSPLEAETGNQLTSRAWLAAEILCTWKWPGGSAIDFFLSSLTAYIKGNSDPRDNFLDSIFNMLLDGALVHGGVGQQRFITIQHYPSLEVEEIQEPFLRAIANFLVTLFKDHIWGAEKATTLLELLVDKLFIGEEVNIGCLKILPVIVSVLTRSLWQRSSESDGVSESDFGKESFIQNTIEGWLQRTLSFAPLILWQSGEDMEDWFHLIISCYPFSGTKGVYSSRLKRKISSREKELLLELFRKQRQVSGASPAANQLPMVQMLLSELQIVSVDYCWEQFNEEDWDFLLSQIRRWIQTAVVMMEEITEAVDDAITNSLASTSLDVCKKLEQIVLVSDPFPFDIARNSLLSFSLFPESLEFQHAKEAESINVVKSDKRDSVKDRILEGILRLFFCTGLSEVIANSCSHDAASVISSSRLERSCFWDLVASHVAHSPKTARERAMKSVEFWGLSKGPISSLYAILFSSNPLPSLQSAAYVMLSTDPICHVAITKEEITRNADSDTTTDQDSSQIDLSSEETIQLKEEISYMIERLPIEVLDTDLTAQKRVNAFLAWSLLLSHIWSLPSSTPAKERLVHYIQNSTSSMILDCLFQHIPVESMLNIQKKKDAKLPEGLSEAAAAAKQAITTGSLFIYVESLWPIDHLKMASFAGAIFGLMLCILPAYVRGWFSDLRDRSESSGIESFTRAWCSPSLIVNELSQIKKAEIADENFSVSVSKAANEIVATYTKDETGMDLVIRLPPSYPLRLLDVECMKSLGISEVKKRKWLLSMTSFLRNQNGALAEAIGVWKRNYDKEFEGVEECPICYSVIHTSNHRMPRLACRTCKHKFHDACLYRWFQTSHKSSCPLCQSPF